MFNTKEKAKKICALLDEQEIINKYELLQYNNVFDYKNRINSFFEIN